MPRRQDLQMSGGIHTDEVIMRKRSENKTYYDNDGIRDSIVMSDLSGGLSDFLGRSILREVCISMLELKGIVDCLK